MNLMEFIRENDHIDLILDRYRDVLGDSFVTYRNHVYRIVNLVEMLTPRRLTGAEVEKFAIAAAFHDIGLWSDHTLDYLAPSAALACKYLESIKRAEWEEEITAMINWHHKVTVYKGPYAEAVNLFRKADWIDVSRGLRHFGVDRGEIVHLYAEFPEEGFHRYLLKRGTAWAIRHPLRPLPIFRI